MGKLVLISGANDSGKSVYAEKLVGSMNGEKYYIATMKPVNDDNHRRILKHKKQRVGLGFETLEMPYNIDKASMPEGALVLLEDVSNLMANSGFELGHGPDAVFESITALAERCGLLAAVSISGLTSKGYDADTAAYIDNLNYLNGLLFSAADCAVEMRGGKAHVLKGDINAFL